jgi:peptidoglycan/xylan/chitin deacetylase (PgdA/CDA1 family)
MTATATTAASRRTAGARHAIGRMRAAGRRVGNRHRGLILMYHRVASPTHDPHALAVHPRRFAEHVEILRGRGDVVPLRDLTHPARGHRLAVTFDDGHADNAIVARPLLEAAGLPATMFVTAGCLGARGFWWNDLAALVFGARSQVPFTIAFDGTTVTADLTDGDQRVKTYRALHRRLRARPPARVGAALEELRHAFGDVPLDDTDRIMTTEEVRELARSSVVTVGAHTMSHPLLASLNADDQAREMTESRRLLEDITGRPVREFAYPFGTPDAFDESSVQTAASAGFDIACTTIPALVRRGTDPFRLPRYFVGDWDGDVFTRHLEKWLASR